LCRDQLEAEIYDGTLFVFRNRRGAALKVLCFDGVGWWLVIRRFSQGRLQWWPKAQADTLTHPLEAQQLQVLLYNGLPEQASFVSPWFVEEINLTVNISALRKALGESPNDHRYIVTAPRRGYRFVAEVREIKNGEAPATGATQPAQSVPPPGGGTRASDLPARLLPHRCL
jgi:hypothetical protein